MVALTEVHFFGSKLCFLHSAIVSVWKEHQKNWFQDLRKEKRRLIIGSDERGLMMEG